MRDDTKRERHLQITQAAYRLLASRGYNSTSMLIIAKEAKASNETLYRWYGNKIGLFSEMVSDNVADIKIVLEQAIKVDVDPTPTLERLSPLLLEMLLGERAILLNRAAAADPTGELGAAISAGGRNTVVPLIYDLIFKLSYEDEEKALQFTNCYLDLLVGDQQVRRITGVIPVPTKAEIEKRAAYTLKSFFTLMDAT